MCLLNWNLKTAPDCSPTASWDWVPNYINQAQPTTPCNSHRIRKMFANQQRNIFRLPLNYLTNVATEISQCLDTDSGSSTCDEFHMQNLQSNFPTNTHPSLPYMSLHHRPTFQRNADLKVLFCLLHKDQSLKVYWLWEEGEEKVRNQEENGTKKKHGSEYVSNKNTFDQFGLREENIFSFSTKFTPATRRQLKLMRPQEKINVWNTIRIDQLCEWSEASWTHWQFKERLWCNAVFTWSLFLFLAEYLPVKTV